MGLFTKNNPASGGGAAPSTPSVIPPAPSPITAAESQLIAPTPGTTIAPRPVVTPAAPATPRQSPVSTSNPLNERQTYFQQLRVRIHQKLVERLDIQNMRSLPPDVVRNEVRALIRDLCQSEKGLINGADQEK